MKRNVWVGFVAPWIGFTLLWADFGMDFGAPSYLRRLGYGLVIGFISCGMTYAIKSLALNPVLNWMAKQQRRPSSPPDALTNSPRSEQPMEARLYELIRDYQADRVAVLGGPLSEFRETALRQFALRRPDRYPEYILEDGRLTQAIAVARAAGEILPPATSNHDEPLILRIDRRRAT